VTKPSSKSKASSATSSASPPAANSAPADIVRAIHEKVPLCEAQQERMGCDFGATFVRRYGGKYLVVMTPEQFAALWREAA
jgi:hypothetical protein